MSLQFFFLSGTRGILRTNTIMIVGGKSEVLYVVFAHYVRITYPLPTYKWELEKDTMVHLCHYWTFVSIMYDYL